LSFTHKVDADPLRTVFERTAWDAERFRGFRCRVSYPVPFISWTMWFDLPPPP